MEVFKTRNEMIEKFESGLKIAELGVFKGEFAKILYEKCKPQELFLVDLFNGQFGSGDKDGNNYHFVNLEEEMVKIINHFESDPNVKVIKSSTTDFLLSLNDNYLDLVYIDADHSYHSVLEDLNSAYPKVKQNGFICGHDYVENSEAKNAVDHFCKTMNLEIEYITQDGCPSFCIIKNK